MVMAHFLIGFFVNNPEPGFIRSNMRAENSFRFALSWLVALKAGKVHRTELPVSDCCS
jgi:hypothetical protein